MKFLFVDEFKENRKNTEFYGLSAILIDNSSYSKFKNGFYSRLEELGWDPSIEIKGRYSFSKKGDAKVSIEDRLKFVEKLFELSKSKNGKYASAQCFYTFNIFKKGIDEMTMYSDLLLRIFKKMPKGKKRDNKNGKNNIVVFLDSNNAINTVKMSDSIEKVVLDRNLCLVERCFFVDSGNKTPGIIFADHVAFFINKFFKTNRFNEKNSVRIKELLVKFSHGKFTEQEKAELKRFLISIKKEDKTVHLLSALKKLKYV